MGAEGHADQVYSGALYAMNGDGGNLYMTVCPADEYDDIITVGDDPAMQVGTEAPRQERFPESPEKNHQGVGAFFS